MDRLYNGLETMTDEADIIMQVRAGDTEAFHTIVQDYQRPLFGFVQQLLMDTADTQDLVQEVFLTAFNRLDSFDPALSRFSTWLYTIARNKVINANKKKRPRHVSELPEPRRPAGQVDALVRDELYAQLDRALNRLPAKKRRAFVLTQIEQLSYEEVAQIEGTRSGTIKSRVNRARHILQASLVSMPEVKDGES